MKARFFAIIILIIGLVSAEENPALEIPGLTFKFVSPEYYYIS